MLRLLFSCFFNIPDNVLCNFCQYLVSVPLKMFRLWAFLGMMAQVSLKYSILLVEHQIKFLISHSTSCFRSRWPILWADSWGETTATPPSGCRWSLASRSPCSCTSTTITCCIMGVRRRASLHDATISAITEMLNVKTMHIFLEGKYVIFNRLQPKSNVIISPKDLSRCVL